MMNLQRIMRSISDLKYSKEVGQFAVKRGELKMYIKKYG